MSQGVIGSLKQGSAATGIRSLLDLDSPARGLKGIGLLSHQVPVVEQCSAEAQSPPVRAEPEARRVLKRLNTAQGLS